MQQTLAGGRFVSPWRFIFVLALCFGWATVAVAITSEAAIALCEDEMLSEAEALSLRDLKVRRHDDVPYVYGNADFSDIKGIHFRCKIYHDKVRELRYLVKDPEYVNGRA